MPRNDQLWTYTAQCLQDSKDWFPDVQLGGIEHHVLALCGEVGELANLTKKIQRGSLDPSNEKVMTEFRMELADILTYLLVIAGRTSTDLANAYEVKRTENKRRFGSGPRKP